MIKAGETEPNLFRVPPLDTLKEKRVFAPDALVAAGTVQIEPVLLVAVGLGASAETETAARPSSQHSRQLVAFNGQPLTVTRTFVRMRPAHRSQNHPSMQRGVNPPRFGPVSPVYVYMLRVWTA